MNAKAVEVKGKPGQKKCPACGEFNGVRASECKKCQTPFEKKEVADTSSDGESLAIKLVQAIGFDGARAMLNKLEKIAKALTVNKEE